MKAIYILTTMLAAYSTMGCGRDCEGTWTYDPNQWTSIELQSMRLAARDWNEFSGRDIVHIEERNNTNQKQCQIKPGTTFSNNDEKAGVFRFMSGEIEINTSEIRERSLPEDYSRILYAVILHEIGHGLGMDHVKGIHNIMYPEVGHTKWGAEDWNECVDMGICKE